MRTGSEGKSSGSDAAREGFFEGKKAAFVHLEFVFNVLSPLVEEGNQPGTLEFLDCFHKRVAEPSTGKTSCEFLSTARETSGDVVAT